MPYFVLGLKRMADLDKDYLALFDTERREVTEVMVHSEESLRTRKPTSFEVHEVAKTLHDSVEERILREDIRALRAEKGHLEARLEGSRQRVDDQRDEINELKEIIDGLKERAFDADTTAVIATALELRIEELAMAQHLSEYVKAKEAYQKLTGRSWVDED